MIAQFRTGIRLQRFELVAATLAVAALALSAVIIRARLDAIGVTAECWAAWFGSGGSTPCTPGGSASPASAFLTINNDEAGPVMGAMALLPLAVGLFLGVGLVAREIEGGTAPTFWALARSRTRWLAGRLLPPLVIATMLLSGLAIASEILWAGREPWGPALRFDDAGGHGPVLVAKGVAALGLALLVGAVLGRILPAVIVSAILALALYVGGEMARGLWLQDEATRHVVVSDPAQVDLGQPFPGGTFFSPKWKTADGQLLDDQAAQALVPAGKDPWEWLSSNLTPVSTGVPGTMYPAWARLETMGFAAIGVASIGASFLVVRRRRPV